MKARFALAGSPVASSPSPAMHNAGFSALRLDASYELRPAERKDVDVLLAELRAGSWQGLNVTTPIKVDIAARVAKLGAARLSGSVNTLWVHQGELVGDSTDVRGVRAPLTELEPPDRRKALIIGAGGAARAAAVALEELDYQINIASRKPRAGDAVLQCVRSGSRGATLAAHDFDGVRALWPSLGVVVQATPVGRDGEEHKLPWQLTHEGAIAFEMLYSPRMTPFLHAAKRVGCRTIEGWQMLLEQGIGSFEIWTGRRAPRLAMQEALLSAIG